MLKTALALFTIGCMAAWGQAPNETTGAAVKVDRATAYYHYTLACMYARMAAVEGHSAISKREYEDKAIENYKAALKSDPQTPMYTRGLTPPLLSIIPIGPGRRPPKADPTR